MSSTMSFFAPVAGSVMFEYFVRCAPELAAVCAATTGSGLRSSSAAMADTVSTPKYGSRSLPSKTARAEAALQASMVLPPPTATMQSGLDFATDMAIL
ncbi:MAG: hypothetical protein BWY28_02379 [bacterium ADurb.Bin236]|nr:MAG: hypothetical protein BWY28_02379 [bacterium ADurb.Bin236]